MDQQPAIAIGATYTCICGTPVRRVSRVGDPGNSWTVEDLSWSRGVFVVGRLHECVERSILPPMSGAGGRVVA